MNRRQMIEMFIGELLTRERSMASLLTVIEQTYGVRSDDDEPLTDERLERFECIDREEGSRKYGIYHDDHGWLAWRSSGGSWYMEPHLMRNPPKTVGDFRRLCEALGIETKERGAV